MHLLQTDVLRSINSNLYEHRHEQEISLAMRNLLQPCRIILLSEAFHFAGSETFDLLGLKFITAMYDHC